MKRLSSKESGEAGDSAKVNKPHPVRGPQLKLARFRVYRISAEGIESSRGEPAEPETLLEFMDFIN